LLDEPVFAQDTSVGGSRSNLARAPQTLLNGCGSMKLVAGFPTVTTSLKTLVYRLASGVQMPFAALLSADSG